MICLFVIVSVVSFLPIEHFNNENKLQLIQIFVTIIGGGWALKLYYNSNFKNNFDYLKLSVNTKKEERVITITTYLINDTPVDREVEASFLIVNKQGLNYVESINEYLNTNLKSTNELIYLKKNNSFYNEDIMFYQLPFYNRENIKVGNENLTFSVGFIENENNNENRIYEVRFFVFRSVLDSNPYHRSVQTIFSSKCNLESLYNNTFNNN